MSRKFQGNYLFIQKDKPGRIRLYFLILISILALIYGSIFLWSIAPSSSNTPDNLSYKVKISPQSSLASIAQQLSDQGLVVAPYIFQISARALFVGSKLKPGTYLLPLRASLGKILLQIARGDRVKESISIIPGMAIWQVRALIDAHPSLLHETRGITSKQLLQAINLNYPSDEGLFFPDTYVFDPEESDLNIYRRASQAMQKQLERAWDQRNKQIPLTSPYQLLTLASIVEKETGRAGDRGLVAAVFVNRLNKNMPLQTDPTVIYGLGPHFDGNLRKADLRKDSPYNTYMHKGLTPSPIAMPSGESLVAAAHPDKTDAIYFVARGDGSSHFSKTLNEHEDAVDRYQRKTSSKTH